MQFHDKTHSYININNETYISVTSILKGLEVKKDWDDIAKKYAKKHNLTLKEVKEKWAKEKDASLVRGKKYHAMAESETLLTNYAFIVNEKDEKVELPIHKSISIGDIKYESKQILIDGIYPEIILWLDEYKIAGQADKVIIHDNLIDIIDYKTSKTIDKTGFVNFKTGKSAKLISPVDHLDECNWSIYCLQLNFYAYIIKKNNPKYRIRRMIIKHILYNNKTNEITGTKDYLVPNLQKEIQLIIDTLK